MLAIRSISASAILSSSVASRSALPRSCGVFSRFYASLPPHMVIKMPALSPTMTQGNIGTWKKKIGDSVTAGDILVEIETDKAQMEFECQDEGFLAKILMSEGSKEVPVGTPIAVMCEESSDVASFANFKAEAAAAPASAPKEKSSVPAAENSVQPATTSATPAASTATIGDRIFASPLAKVMAKEANLPLSGIQGSGPNARIVKSDVERAIAQGVEKKPVAAVPKKAAPAPATEFDTPYEEIPLTNMRKVIAGRLSDSKSTIPHYYLTAEISMDRALKLREVLNGKLLENGEKDAKISVNDLVIKATALALKEVPDVNAAWWPETNSIRMFKRADISVAVATESGLITPIVRAAEQKGLAGISREVRSLASKAKANKLQPHEFQGGSFTISNLGMFGSISQFTAIINPPQAAILAVGGLSERIVRSPTEENQFVAEQVMKVTLSCDHRVIDGALGAKWLAAFKRLMEEPLQMML